MWFPTLGTFKGEQHLPELDVLMRSKEQNYLMYETSTDMIKSTHHIIKTACPSKQPMSPSGHGRSEMRFKGRQRERERERRPSLARGQLATGAVIVYLIG